MNVMTSQQVSFPLISHPAFVWGMCDMLPVLISTMGVITEWLNMKHAPALVLSVLSILLRVLGRAA